MILYTGYISNISLYVVEVENKGDNEIYDQFKKRGLALILLCVCMLFTIAGRTHNLIGEVEKNVTVDNNRSGMPAIVHTPKDGADRCPLVVFCHSFKSDYNGCGLFPDIAQRLAPDGIASIRMNFPGNGTSKEVFTDYTIKNMINDITMCITYMRDHYYIDTPAVGLIGHSMGGRVASLYLSNEKDKYPIAAAALLSPSNGEGEKSMEFFSPSDEACIKKVIVESETNGEALVTPWGVIVSRTYVEEMLQSHPNEALMEYDIPLFLSFTGNEVAVSDDTKIKTIAAVSTHPENQIETECFLEASHTYAASDPVKANELNSLLKSQLVDMLGEFMYDNLTIHTY